jgi:hypothetical protein
LARCAKRHPLRTPCEQRCRCVELLSALYGTVRAGWTAVATDAVEQLLGRAPISVEQFTRNERAAWI